MAWQNNPWAQQNGYPQSYGNQMTQTNPYGQRMQSNMDWIRVPNLPDIDQVTVQPGQTAWVMAQNTNVFAVRSATRWVLLAPGISNLQSLTPARLISRNKQIGSRSRPASSSA